MQLGKGRRSTMRKPLLDVLFASDKRKNTLLLLQDGPKEMEALLQSLHTTRQALLAQIRILENSYLIAQNGDTCKLTTAGKLLVDEFSPLLATLKLFDTDIDYWGSRNLDFIPPYLLARTRELNPCTVITPRLPEIYDVNREFHQESMISRSLLVLTTVFHPGFQSMYQELLSAGIDISIVISNELFEKIITSDVREFRSLVQMDGMHVSLCKSPVPLMYFAQNEHCSLFSLLKDNGETDNKLALCEGSAALGWGKELFDHYFRESIPLDNI